MIAETKEHRTPITSMGYFTGVNVPEYEQILNCVRCGMCLPHCPTYSEMKVERASPRGRAALIRAVADGKLELSKNFAKQVFLCLDCRACETACPSGVHIGYLIESARSQVVQNLPKNPFVKLFKHFIFGWLFMRHWRLELLAALPLRIYQKSGLQAFLRTIHFFSIFPQRLRFMEELAPEGITTPFRKTLPEVLPAKGEEHARVGYFLGCMMSIMFNKTTNATVNVLTRSGCTVITPKSVRCCGAPLMSEGYKHKAFALMRYNVDLFESLDVEYIVTDCAACGAALKEIAEILEDDPDYCEKAHRFSGKVREITEFLGDWPHFKGPEFTPEPCKAIYDAPCHLCHAQQVWEQPKKLIRQVPGVELLDLPEADWCCGSAGIYNITHTDMAMKILDRKMDHIEKTGADLLLTANPGCYLQLRWGVKNRRLPMQVKHVVEILDGRESLKS
ncbi:MAG: (Fe-S)-binding protein [Candidatus Omnitrophota bacterium]|jgi:glycolate oxidase iron-sulfur subunit|nr:MAG: (Fe-S)-binding protein [Candidatus Omnitrophota bacterium]